jgi:hypothetical protein
MVLGFILGIFSQQRLVTLYPPSHGRPRKQGGQIGRIFAYWAIVFFGQLFENYRSSANSWATFFRKTR